MTETSVNNEQNIFKPNLHSLKVDSNDHKVDLTEFQTWVQNNYESVLKVLREKSEAVPTDRPLLIAFHHINKHGIKLKFWCDKLNEVTVKYKKIVDFALADLTSFSLLREWNVFDYGYLHEHEMPWVFAIDGKNRFFEMTKTVNVENLKSFTEELLQGKLFRSEQVPPAQDPAQRVKIAIAKNFDELVYETDKDVFIVFYVPWCRFSQELLPRLEELANLLQDDDDQLMIVKIDAEANYIDPHFNVVSYPKCFFLAKHDKKQLILYNRGTRTIENLIAFIADHSSNELKCYDRTGILKNKRNSKREDEEVEKEAEHQ